MRSGSFCLGVFHMVLHTFLNIVEWGSSVQMHLDLGKLGQNLSDAL